MCSIDDSKANTINQTISNQIIDSDTETQSLSSDSSSGEEAIDETQLLNFDEETQKIDYLDESDGEGTDKTEVLSDVGEGEVGDSDGGFGDDQMCTERVECDSDQECGKDYVVDSDASTDAEPNHSGCVQRDFMSVCAASLQDSGRAAARSKTPKETIGEASSFPCNFLSAKKHLEKDDRMDGLRDALSAGTEVTKVDPDNNLQNCDRKLTEYNDKTKCEGAKSTERKHFDEDSSTGNSVLVNDNDCYDRARELLESPAYDNKFAGLSYVVSQEPGEFSQANALDVVDKFLAVNHFKFSQEYGCGKTLEDFSPPVSRAKGTQSLAKSSGVKIPVRDAKIFDWVDSHEDEGCEGFSDKKKGAFVRSHGQRSRTRPPKPRYLSSSKGRCISDKPSEKDSSNLERKILGLTRSDTRVIMRNSKENDNTRKTSERSITNNLSNDCDEQLNAESLEKPLEGTGNGMDLPDAYDIGFDTQMAAEAMEALCQGGPPNQDADNLYQVSENVTCGSPRVLTNNEAFTKHVYVRKRVSSDSGTTARRSKRRKVDNANCMLSEKDFRGPQMNGPRPVSVLKMKKSNSKAEKHLRNGIGVDGKEDMGYGSSKSVEHTKATAETEKLPNKDLDRCDLSLSMLNDNLEVRSFTPIACRTRRAKAVKPLTGLVLSNGSGVVNSLTDISTRGARRIGTCSGGDAPGSLTTKGNDNKSGSNQIAKVRKGKLIQLEPPGNGGQQEEIAANEKGNLLSYSRVKRTCQNMSGFLTGSNLDGPSTVFGGQDDEQHIPRRKRSIIGVRGLARAKSYTGRGKKVDANTVSFLDGTKRIGMLEVTPGDKVKPLNTSCIALVNGTNAIETPPPICLGRKIPSSRAVPIPASKVLREVRNMVDVRVLLSQHLDDDIIKQQKKISSRLGLSIVSSLSEATHFIADKFVRTRNMLEAIAFGKPVVTHLWLESCGKANSFVDEKNYILRDSEKEKEIGFSMPVSLARARACHGQLLQGKRIFVTPNVKPSKELVASLVTAVHGQVMKRIGRSAMEGDKVSEDLLVLSCEEDYRTCLPLLLKRAAVYSSELLLNGIIIQKLEYERHSLFKDRVKRTDCFKRTPRYA